ncbi:MAG: tRNA-intron lyase [Candidatus Aenigmatarchaeota archaeon]
MKADIREGKVIADGTELYNSGWYGDLEGKGVMLNLVEAMFLLEKGKIEIAKHDAESFFRFCTKFDQHFTARYSVYKDLRERGLPVRLGYKGSDFRVYERGASAGKPGKVKWIVFAEAEDYQCEMDKLGKAIGLAKNIRAIALWAVVDNDLDITYYVINSISP